MACPDAAPLRFTCCFVPLCIDIPAALVQGWHAVMQRQATGSEEVAATAYRAQIKPGAWQGDNTVLLFTNRGCLALQPLTASSYAAWVLGLNLAFAMGTSRLQNHLINRRIRDMPRSPLLMVQGC